MAIEPYQRKIGIPDAAGGGMTRIADTRSFDIGPAISSLGDTLMSTFEPILADEAIKRGNEEAGKVMFTRTEDGQLVLPPPADDGGRRYAAAFDKVIEARYLNEVGTDFQSSLDQEAADRRTGVKKYDAVEYAASVEAKTEGMLSAMDPRIRPQMEEVLRREGLERTRAFTNEVSGNARRNTVQGLISKFNFHAQSLKNHEKLGLTLPNALTLHQQPALAIVESLKQLAAAGEEEADAMIMEIDQDTNGIKSFIEGRETIAKWIPSVDLMNDADLEKLDLILQGVPMELSGVVKSSVAARERLNPEIIKAYYKQKYGIDPSSVDRPETHDLSIKNPRSYHNIKNGGRAIDAPRVPGMTFEQWVQGFKDDGFNVVEAIDEYKNPSKDATGGHWHIALGNTRQVTAEHELPELKNITAESLANLDPSARRLMREIITDRRQEIRAEAAEARREAAETARTDRLIAEERNTQLSIEGALSQGVGGNWNAKEKASLDREFSAIDLNKIGTDPNVRGQVIGFVSKNNYLPESISNFLDNNVRSNNWQPALELYENMKDVTLAQGGGRVGDLILGSLSPTTNALLAEADALRQMKFTPQEIGANIEALRSKARYELPQAKAEFNRGKAIGQGYETVKIQTLSNKLGTKRGYVIPAELVRNFDAAYVANLEITGQPEKAMQRAANQTAAAFKTSTVYQGNVGPASLLRSYDTKTLGNFFFGETDQDGNKLIKRVKGQTHRVGGDNPSVRLKSMDGNTTGIGRYAVYVYEPNNTNNLIDVFEVDLGVELPDHTNRKNTVAQRRSRADLLAEARARRTSQQQTNARLNTFVPMSP